MSKFKTNWSLHNPPTISSALAKNNDGLCAMNNCQNKLSDPPSYCYFSLKVCTECKKVIDESLRQLERDIWNDIFERMKKIL